MLGNVTSVRPQAMSGNVTNIKAEGQVRSTEGTTLGT